MATDTVSGMTDDQLKAAVQQFATAVGQGNTAAAQEVIREFNLNFTNSTAQQYGQNFGVGQPAPPGTPTLAAGQATGSIGYIPGFTGTDASQTQSNIAQQATTAQAAAGLTGFYAAPAQSQYTPGTFVRLDPSTYDASSYGTQISYVLPSGQLQRVNLPQAQAMGWNGNLSTMPTISAQQAIGLESAPPSQLPTQTLAGLSGYSNLNTAAMNQAVAQSGVTGMYSAPAQVLPARCRQRRLDVLPAGPGDATGVHDALRRGYESGVERVDERDEHGDQPDACGARSSTDDRLWLRR